MAIDRNNLKLSDLKVGDMVRIKDDFFHPNMPPNLFKLKGQILTVTDLNPKEASNMNCIRLNETGEGSMNRCWHVDWLILVEKKGSLETDFVNKIIEYLKGNKNETGKNVKN